MSWFYRRKRRDTVDIANRRLPSSVEGRFFPVFRKDLSFRSSPARLVSSRGFLREIEDRREYHPEGVYAPAQSTIKAARELKFFSNGSTRVRRNDRSSYQYPSPLVAFASPSKVAVCIRRKQRSEVMHALGKAGKVGQRKPRFNYLSEVSCK